jgi:hypothetical protein
MKYNAIVDSGIPILKRYDIPDHLIPPVCPIPSFLQCIKVLTYNQDSQVEIDAKIAAGYFGGAKDVKAENLHLTVGRAWEDLEH